jgi:Fungal specific transcription factor domain
LPPKAVADELVECYLRTSEAVYRILHITSFRTDYDALWVLDSEPDTAFLVQLKLVLAIGAITYDDHFSLRASAIHWVHEAHNWLSKPEFKSRLNIQSLQTEILLLLARESVNVGGELVWISAGALFRTAVCMGLHRDPAHLPKRTNFSAEMRRRLWNTILEIALQSSLISGAPPFLSLQDFDTEPPQNFDDDQLVAEYAVPKPEDNFTHSSVAIALRKTFPLRLAITKFLNDLGSSYTYEETLRLDTDLRASYKTLRRTLQAYKSSPLPSPSQFQIRFVDILVNHCLCSLHVPFLGRAKHDAAYAFSRKVTLETSLKVWCAAYPSSSQTGIDTDSATLDDLSRFTVCGTGFLRTSAFRASLLIVVSLKTQLQEEESTGPVPFGPDLFSLIGDAKAWSLRMIKAGETNVKCFLLMSIVYAQMKCRIQGREESASDLPESQSVMMEATEEAEEICLAILQEMAAQGQPVANLDRIEPMSLSVPSELMEGGDFRVSTGSILCHLPLIVSQIADELFNFSNGEPMSWLYNIGSGHEESLW